MPRTKASFKKARGDRRFREVKQQIAASNLQSAERTTFPKEFEAWKATVTPKIIKAFFDDGPGEEEEEEEEEEEANPLSATRDSAVAPFLERYIFSLELEDIRRMMRAYMSLQYNPAVGEMLIYRGLQTILGDDCEPQTIEVATLSKLLFEKRDILLIAQLAFGGPIYQAYSALTGYITLQLIPTSTMSDEQLNSMNQIPGVKACLLDRTHESTEPSLLQRIINKEYTHIMLTPDMLLSPEVRSILSNADFCNDVGLIAIEQCHLMRRWHNVQEKLQQLTAMRLVLPKRVVLFGCTATINSESEDFVLKHGVKPPSPKVRHSQVIRSSSIDRPDVTISVAPIRREGMADYTPLLFLLSSLKSREDILNIPRTIIFVDSPALSAKIANFLRSNMRDIGLSLQDRKTIVRDYSPWISQHDKDVVFQALQETQSTTRIVVAPNALELGMDIPEVEIVVQWNLPPKPATLEDLWQRVGKAARGGDRTRRAYIYLPYWLFNNLGFEEQRTRQNVLSVDSSTSYICGPSFSVWPVEDEDYESDSSVDSQSSTESVPEDSVSTCKVWTESDIEKRRSVDESWLQFVNGECHRKTILQFLQQSQADSDDSDLCCSACNRNQMPPEYDAKDTKVVERPPAEGTRAAIALEKLKEWLREHGAWMLFNEPPGSVIFSTHLFLPIQFQWRLVRPFNNRGFRRDTPLPYGNREELGRAIRPGTWKFLNLYAEPLIEFMNSIRESTVYEYRTRKKGMLQ